MNTCDENACEEEDEAESDRGEHKRKDWSQDEHRNKDGEPEHCLPFERIFISKPYVVEDEYQVWVGVSNSHEELDRLSIIHHEVIRG
jgi:hypothetical protein